MKILPVVLVLVGLPCLGFGWWGLNTVAGRRAYDEMDAIIPFASGALGGFLIVVAAVIAIIGVWRRRASRP
jgi:hypothetical protein